MHKIPSACCGAVGVGVDGGEKASDAIEGRTIAPEVQCLQDLAGQGGGRWAPGGLSCCKSGPQGHGQLPQEEAAARRLVPAIAAQPQAVKAPGEQGNHAGPGGQPPGGPQQVCHQGRPVNGVEAAALGRWRTGHPPQQLPGLRGQEPPRTPTPSSPLAFVHSQ